MRIKSIHRKIKISVIELITLLKKSRYQRGFEGSMNYNYVKTELAKLGLNEEEIKLIY